MMTGAVAVNSVRYYPVVPEWIATANYNHPARFFFTRKNRSKHALMKNAKRTRTRTRNV